MEQKSSFVLFIVTCLIILLGWTWMQNQLWPPPEKKDDDKKAAEKKPEVKKDTPKVPIVWTLKNKKIVTAATAVTALGTADALASLTPAWQAGRALSILDPTEDQRKALTLAEAVATVWNPASVWRVAQAKIFPDVKPETAKVTRVTLGGDGYYLEAVLTSKGAGVEKLILTKFKAADYLGRPTDRPFEMIQEDPYLASYLLYHYLPGAIRDKDNPVTTLGEMIWTLEGHNQSYARFTAKVPNYEGLQITKIFNLGKQDYHVGLTLEIKDTRPEGGAKKEKQKVRYQLAGPRGTPLEGSWYLSTFRNAVIGLSDSRKSLW